MRTSAAVVIAVALMAPVHAQAFLQTETDSLTLELRGNARMNATLGRSARIEGAPGLSRDLHAASGMLRLMADVGVGESVAFEVHVYQLFSGAAGLGLAGVADGFGAQDANRTGALTWRPYSRAGTVAELAFDRANVKLYLPFGQAIVGRQPVNLATTYFFTPNDFFQPFSAQTFFRVYKPGVDAARVDIDLGELSQLTFLGVLGYADLDATSNIEPPAWDPSALLARASTSRWDFEWSVLGGLAPRAYVVGVGVQGELLDWLGIRLEGHVAVPVQDGLRTRAEVAVGIEHRFESSVFLRAEYYYNGSGATDPTQYGDVLLDPLTALGTPYLGRHYAAVGASYELTALLTGDALALVNLTDGSFQLALSLAYSLLDDVDLAFVVSAPFGDPLTVEFVPDIQTFETRFGSEFGVAPVAMSTEVRAFF